MFTIKPAIPYNLSEIRQANPIRWTIVSVSGTEITPLAPEMKCKDYFNDVVAAKNKVYFTQYGFNNKVVPDQEGLDILLTHIKNLTSFKEFLSRVENTDNKIGVVDVDSTSVLIHIPEYYFKNTYRISLITYLIRLCNNPDKYWKTITDLKSCLESKLAQDSSGLNHFGRGFALKHGWDAPSGDDFWWGASINYNSKTPVGYGTGSMIHNCGVNAWSSFQGNPAEVEEDEDEEENV